MPKITVYNKELKAEINQHFLAMSKAYARMKDRGNWTGLLDFFKRRHGQSPRPRCTHYSADHLLFRNLWQQNPS